MLQEERLNDPETSLRVALDGWQAKIWTAMPGKVQSYNAEKMTCEVQPTIKGRQRAPDGKITDIEMPLCVDCPVVFPKGGGWLLTFPIAEGDEVLLVFANRCIDAWWESGGIQKQAQLRMHDLSDGFVIPGPFSTPRVPTDVSTDQVELRNTDGTIKLSTTATGFKVKGTLEVTEGLNVLNEGGAADPFQITGNIKQIGGGFETDGAVSAATVSAGGVDLATHHHGGVTTGGGNTGPALP